MGALSGEAAEKKLARGIDRTFYFIAELLRKLFNVIGKFLGALFVILGTFTVIALLAALFNVADVIHFGADRWSASMDIYEWGEIVFDSSEWLIASVAGLFLLVGIPFIALAYSGLTLLFPGNRIPYLGTALFGLWFLGLVLTIFSGFSILKSFSKEETVIERYALEELGIRQDTLIIRSGSDPFNISASRGYSANRDFMIKLSDDKVTRGNLEFTIMEMPSKRAVVEICKRSEGATFDQAQSKAEAINYSFENDSNTLIFNPFFTFPSRDLLRAQELTIHLSMTEGMVVFLDESSKRIIKDIPNVTNIYDPYMTGHYWKMEKEGLICLDCEEIEKSDAQNEGIKEVSIQVNID